MSDYTVASERRRFVENQSVQRRRLRTAVPDGAQHAWREGEEETACGLAVGDMFRFGNPFAPRLNACKACVAAVAAEAS